MYRQLKPPPKVNPRAPPAHLFEAAAPPPSNAYDYEADVLEEMARLEADLLQRLERDKLSQSQTSFSSYHSPHEHRSPQRMQPKESPRYDPIPMQQDFDFAYEEPVYAEESVPRRKGGGIATLGGDADDRRNMKAAKAAAYASQLQQQIDEQRRQHGHSQHQKPSDSSPHHQNSAMDVYERPIYDDRSRHVSDKQLKQQQQEAYRRQLELQIREKERKKEQEASFVSPSKRQEAHVEERWRSGQSSNSHDKKRAAQEHHRMLQQQAEEDRRRREEERMREEQEDIRLQLAAGNRPQLAVASDIAAGDDAQTHGAKKRREIEQRRELERRILDNHSRYPEPDHEEHGRATHASPSNAARQRQIRDVYGHAGDAESHDDLSQWRPSGRGQNIDKKRAAQEHHRLLQQQAEEDRRRKEVERMREEQEDIRLQLAAGGSDGVRDSNVETNRPPISDGESLGAKKRREIEQRRELERRMQEDLRLQERHEAAYSNQSAYGSNDDSSGYPQPSGVGMKSPNAARARQLRDVYGHQEEDMSKDAKKRAAQEHRRLLEQQAEEARRRKEEEQRREEEEDIRLQLAAGDPIGGQTAYDRPNDGMSLGAKKRREIEQRRELERQVQLKLQQQNDDLSSSEYRETPAQEPKKPNMRSPNAARARQIRDVYGHHDGDELPADAKHRAMLERKRELDQQAEENRLRKEQERKQNEQEDILLDMKVREGQPPSLRRADSVKRSPVANKNTHPTPRGTLGAQKRAQIEERRRMEAELAAQMSPRAERNERQQTPERRDAAIAPEASMESMVGFAHDRTPERPSPQARRFGQYEQYNSQDFGSPSRLSLASVYDNASVLSPQRPGYNARDLSSGSGTRLKTESAFMPASTMEREYPHEYRRDGVSAEDHFVVEWQQRNGYPSRRGITPVESSRRLDGPPQHHVPYVDPFGPDGFLSGLAVKKSKKKKDSSLVEQSLTSESLLFYMSNESAPPSRGNSSSQREYGVPKSPLAAMIDESNSRHKVHRTSRPAAKKTDSLENLIHSTNQQLQRNLLDSRPATRESTGGENDNILLKSSRSERPADLNEESAEVLIMPPTSAHGTKPRYLDHDTYGERYLGYYDDQMRYQYFHHDDTPAVQSKELQRPGSSHMPPDHEPLPSSRASSRRSTKSTSLREYSDARPRSVHSRGSERLSSKGNNEIANIDYDDDEAIEATWFADK